MGAVGNFVAEYARSPVPIDFDPSGNDARGKHDGQRDQLEEIRSERTNVGSDIGCSTCYIAAIVKLKTNSCCERVESICPVQCIG